MTNLWFGRATSGTPINARFSDASDALVSTLQDANSAIARQSAAGLEFAHAFGDEAVAAMRRAGRSTRTTISRWPVESIAVVALFGLAAGWVLRRACEPTVEEGAPLPRTQRDATKARARRVRPARSA